MTAAADRHLLFGLLALQNGIINQGQLLAGFQAWTLDKSRSLADHLEARGDLTPAKRALLEALAEVHLDAHGGDVEKSLAAVSAGKSTQESLARIGGPEVEATLACVGSGSNGSSAAHDRTMTLAVGTATSDGQRFRVLRPHARGGLGAVFVALDAELHREVALKQILDGHADDPVSRQRFLLEAEITGGLEHPGIVPVYGLGTYPNGRPYYAMRFIRGDSLKEAIERFHGDPALKKNPGSQSLELRKLLRRFLDVCDAVEYAHSRGVFHRDIKPSNVILGKHGETLLVDWGLAKPIGKAQPTLDLEERTLRPSSASGMGDTLPGSAQGTPAYMSPEQAAGDLDRLGPASDVYSLGATLYFLLAGRSPFQGDVVEILRAVQQGKFPPPRSVAPWVDRSLEAICLKAMALKPIDRYTSARALAVDVERWMADEPVSAHVEPLRARLARWERRHKVLVYGIVTVLAITAVGLGITASVVAEQKRISERAKARADQSAAEAEGNFMMAANAAMALSMASDQQLSQMPGMTKVRKELAETAVRDFLPVMLTKPNDPYFLSRAGRIHSNLAYARAATGDLSGASSEFTNAIRVLERREKVMGGQAAIPDDHVLLEELIKVASFLEDRGMTYEPAYYFAKYRAQARQRADEVLARSPGATDNDLWRYQMAGRMDLIDGHVARANGEFDLALALYERAAERIGIARKAAHWVWIHLWVAHAHRGLGIVAHETGDEPKADREFTAALTIIRAQVAADAEKVDPRFVLAWTQMQNGQRLATVPARGAEADAAIAEAFTIVEKLRTEFPEETRYASLRARILTERALRSAAAGNDEPAERDLLETHDALMRLTFKERDTENLPIQLARVENALGKLRVRQGRVDEARKHFSTAIDRLKDALKKRPKNVEARRELSDVQMGLNDPPKPGRQRPGVVFVRS